MGYGLFQRFQRYKFGSIQKLQITYLSYSCITADAHQFNQRSADIEKPAGQALQARSAGFTSDRTMPFSKYCYLCLLVGFFSVPLHAAEIDTLQQLLDAVKQDKLQEQQLNIQRINEFKAKREQQAMLLQQAQQTLEQLEAKNHTLQEQLQDNNQQILQQRAELGSASQDLHSIFKQSRQLARDIQARFHHSLISAEKPERTAQLQALSDSQETLSLAQIKQLWHLMLEDMVANSEIQRFQAALITADGQEAQREVLRVGSFNATADGAFLRYLPDTGKLMLLPQQPTPPWSFSFMPAETHTKVASHVVDPSRGEVLDLLEQTPNWLERVQQGGAVSYIILALAALSLLLVIERLLVLWWLRRGMRKQLRQPEKPMKNPLGRVLAVYHAQPERDTESLELKLDEAILREIPSLKRGLSTLAVFAAIAPLLGLLGTVTGIIHTFQAITLQGAGDPKIMSGGISEALVTTELGLLVAIPLLLLHSLLRGMSNGLVHILDEQSAALVAQQAEQNHKKYSQH